MRARRGGWAAVLLAGATGVAGLGPVLWLTASPAWAFVAPVKIDERAGGGNTFEFAPTVVRVDVDDKVLWTNKSRVRHTVTSDAGADRFDSDEIPPGGQWERRFTVAGTYTYHCQIHPDMVGRVEVGPPPTTTTAPPPTTTTTPPAPPTTAPPPTTTTEPPTTTTTAPRPAAGFPDQPLPPVPNSAPAAPPPTRARATSSTTTIPPTTTTTAAPPTTVTTAPPPPAPEGEAAPPAPPPESPPTTDTAPPAETGDEIPAAIGPNRSAGDGVDAATAAMVSALIAVGAFAAWTLIRVRPGRI